MTALAAELLIEARHFPGPPLNVNDIRGHTRYTSAKTAPWRRLGALLARSQRLPRPLTAPVQIWAEFRFPDDRRRDTPNLYPTVKALVDGLQDAGVLDGDHDGAVEGPWLKRTYPNGPRQIRLVLVPLSPAELGAPHPKEIS